MKKQILTITVIIFTAFATTACFSKYKDNMESKYGGSERINHTEQSTEHLFEEM